MRLTVSQWTNVQAVLAKRPDGDTLEIALIDNLIEDRTWGKRWSQEVGIGLDPKSKKIVEEALEKLATKASPVWRREHAE